MSRIEYRLRCLRTGAETGTTETYEGRIMGRPVKPTNCKFIAPMTLGAMLFIASNCVNAARYPPVTSIRYVENKCLTGHADSCSQRAKLESSGDYEVATREKVKFFKSACKRGVAEACNQFSLLADTIALMDMSDQCFRDKMPDICSKASKIYYAEGWLRLAFKASNLACFMGAKDNCEMANRVKSEIELNNNIRQTNALERSNQLEQRQQWGQQRQRDREFYQRNRQERRNSEPIEVRIKSNCVTHSVGKTRYQDCD